MTKLALFVELEAKPGREDEVAAFLAGAQAAVTAESGAVSKNSCVTAWGGRPNAGEGRRQTVRMPKAVAPRRRKGPNRMGTSFFIKAQQMAKATVPDNFYISENGTGSYRLLAILRWVMVVIFLAFGIQKFTPQSAHGIALYISNSPLVSWLSIFGIRGEAYLLGVIELSIGVILAVGAFKPMLSAIGSLAGVATFTVTWSFFFSTPGAVKWSLSTDPIAWNLTGEFLFKDIVLLSVCMVLFLASLPKAIVSLRTE